MQQPDFPSFWITGLFSARNTSVMSGESGWKVALNLARVLVWRVGETGGLDPEDVGWKRQEALGRAPVESYLGLLGSREQAGHGEAVLPPPAHRPNSSSEWNAVRKTQARRPLGASLPRHSSPKGQLSIPPTGRKPQHAPLFRAWEAWTGGTRIRAPGLGWKGGQWRARESSGLVVCRQRRKELWVAGSRGACVVQGGACRGLSLTCSVCLVLSALHVESLSWLLLPSLTVNRSHLCVFASSHLCFCRPWLSLWPQQSLLVSIPWFLVLFFCFSPCSLYLCVPFSFCVIFWFVSLLCLPLWLAQLFSLCLFRSPRFFKLGLPSRAPA